MSRKFTNHTSTRRYLPVACNPTAFLALGDPTWQSWEEPGMCVASCNASRLESLPFKASVSVLARVVGRGNHEVVCPFVRKPKRLTSSMRQVADFKNRAQRTVDQSASIRKPAHFGSVVFATAGEEQERGQLRLRSSCPLSMLQMAATRFSSGVLAIIELLSLNELPYHYNITNQFFQ